MARPTAVRCGYQHDLPRGRVEPELVSRPRGGAAQTNFLSTEPQNCTQNKDLHSQMLHLPLPRDYRISPAPDPETYDTILGKGRETVEKSGRLNIYPKETESSKRNYLNRKRQKCS